MIRTQKYETLQYLTADGITVPHGFTTRLGGVSTGTQSSLNLAVGRGDSLENVEENLRRLGRAVGFDPEKLVMTLQIHSDIVRVVTEKDHIGLCHRDYPKCDALVTNTPGVALLVFTADCTPLLFFDPVTGAVGAAHAGWRGTAQAIGAKVVHAMAENFTSHIFMENCAPVNRLTYHVFSKTYKMVDAIHYPTQFLRDLYEKMYGPTNGYVISNGVNAVFRPQNVEKPAEYAGKFIIVATGRYSKEKNQAVLIRAVNRSKYRDRIQLVLAGSGPKEKALKKLSKSLPVPPRFGFFPHGDMVKLLNYADLYVHSAAMEAEGISCLEAISCGLVPIISDSPRCATQAYALTDRSKFRFDSPADLAVKIDWWLDNPEERAAWSRKYAENAAGQFDQEKCMDAMERMLLETAGKA